MTEPKIYEVDVEIAPSHQPEILDYIVDKYLKTKKDTFISINRRANHLYFKVQEPDKAGKLMVEVEADNPLKIVLTPEADITPEFMHVIKEDLLFMVQLFEDNLRHSTLYFSWIEGKDIIPEKAPTAHKRISDRHDTDLHPFFRSKRHLIPVVRNNLRHRCHHNLPAGRSPLIRPPVLDKKQLEDHLGKSTGTHYPVPAPY
jgi:hypothetical protein